MSFDCPSPLSDLNLGLSSLVNPDSWTRDLAEWDRDIWRPVHSPLPESPPSSSGLESWKNDLGWPRAPTSPDTGFSRNFGHLTDSQGSGAHSIQSSPPQLLDMDYRHTEADPSIVRRLHVSNIPFRFREVDLQMVFQKFGVVTEAEIIYNTRGSKGFGFVTFARLQDALCAQQSLNNTFIEGRLITVSNATAKRPSLRKTPPKQPTSGCCQRRPDDQGCCTESNQFMIAMAMAYAFADVYHKRSRIEHVQYAAQPRTGLTFH